MAGMCENANMSAESHLSVLMIGWLWRMSNLACWKQGHSLSKWSNVSGSSQNLHSSETSSGYILLWSKIILLIGDISL